MSILPKAMHKVNPIPIKILIASYTRRRKYSCKISMEPQKPLGSQNYSERKERSWRNHHSRSQDILQNHSNKNNMVFQKNGTKLKTQT